MFRPTIWRIVGATALAGLATLVLLLQSPGPGQAQQGGGGRQQQQEQAEEPGPQLPTDPRLLQLHRDFIQKAEKLASEYEQKKDLDKARVVYEEILKLVPKHPKAVQALEKLNQQELSAERKVIEIFANKPLQDTGIVVVPGKPVHFSVAGTWTLNMSHVLGPNGMEIPKELREYNLGSLVGGVDTGNQEDFKPFLVGTEFEFVAAQPGRLMLGMWDSDHDDNSGKLTVTIQGTFRKR